MTYRSLASVIREVTEKAQKEQEQKLLHKKMEKQTKIIDNP